MESFKLGELEGIFSGRFVSKQDTNVDGKYLYLTGRNIQNGRLVTDKKKDKYVDENEKYKKYTLREGDIIISGLWTNRKVYTYKSSDPPCFVSRNWIVLRTTENNYLSKYFKVEKYLRGFESDCESRLRGGVIPFLTVKDLCEIEVLKIPDEELETQIEDQKEFNLEESQLFESIKQGNIEKEEKDFLIHLVKEHFEDPILKLSKQHESNHLEFKSSLRKDLEREGQIPESVIIHSVVKTIGGFCNTGGGDLLIGVSDNNEIIGIEVDEYNDLDHFLRSLTQQIENNTVPDVMNLPDVIDITTVTNDSKTVCRVNVNPTPVNVLVKYKNKEVFYKRKGPKTVELEGSELLEYLEHKKSTYD